MPKPIRRTAFTLIELLVVITIIALLVAIAAACVALDVKQYFPH